MRRAFAKFGSPVFLAFLLVAGFLVVYSGAQVPAMAQASALENGPPPPPPEDEPSPPPPKKDVPPAAASAEPAAPPAPVWDPLHAKKSLEVGTFYLKKGDYDAAIDRFQEAARLQPGMAKPFLYLGQAYEKKNESANAVSAYRKYLDLYHDAPDRQKILKRIEKLQTQAAHEETSRGSG